ncbi:hypothetical protein QBC35DRAFT_387434 [Podospora australis]|uniref:Clr5 domain-containing protein n=1 Tax=Podospora australis TaxID=1536484 RepID=A0AAN7AHX8_9PEZI|nr:hypothetical protein QBC35DRAFT_387434 [Podospora australis]
MTRPQLSISTSNLLLLHHHQQNSSTVTLAPISGPIPTTEFQPPLASPSNHLSLPPVSNHLYQTGAPPNSAVSFSSNSPLTDADDRGYDETHDVTTASSVDSMDFDDVLLPAGTEMEEKPLVPSSSADWEAKKSVIKELYMDQNQILNDVMKTMLETHKFRATARMYKGQFQKWNWMKYNKSGAASGTTKTAKSRVGKKRINKCPSRHIQAITSSTSSSTASSHNNKPLIQFHILLHPSEESARLETILLAYEALITHWSSLGGSAPWKIPSPPSPFTPISWSRPQNQEPSILQQIRQALDLFDEGLMDRGGIVLRNAFLRIERALCTASYSGTSPSPSPITPGEAVQQAPLMTIEVEVIWDCLLAVPQLILAKNRPEILVQFTRFVAQFTSFKFSQTHPLAKIARNLLRLAVSMCMGREASYRHLGQGHGGVIHVQQHQQQGEQMLQLYVRNSWELWLDLITKMRGAQDHVTIHLKRGYAVLRGEGEDTSQNRAARSLLSDCVLSLTVSLQERGEVQTTERILELEALLARMYLPLFNKAKAERANVLLMGIIGRVTSKEETRGKDVADWSYEDRYLVFSVRYFLACIAENMGEKERARELRRECLGLPGSTAVTATAGHNGGGRMRRDSFWEQTALFVEGTLRADGSDEAAAEANEIMRERLMTDHERDARHTEATEA